MVNLDIHLERKSVKTPDAESRLRNALRILAEMVINVVEAGRDSREIPVVDLPLVADAVSSPPDHIRVLEV